MLRRGFKKEAHALAREVRADLGLTPADPLDPFALASFLEIPVYPLSDLRDGAAEEVRHLMERDPSAFSAVTIFESMRKTIWHNDGHALVRQRSNLAHEIAHALLFHPRAPTRIQSALDRGIERPRTRHSGSAAPSSCPTKRPWDSHGLGPTRSPARPDTASAPRC
jgi:hypothetical protein